MGSECIEKWSQKLKDRGIKTFESKDLPDDLRDRTMIIRAKHAGFIKKSKISNKGSKGSTIRIEWEVL